jgi:pimeloyl-ACP methyl ester carboxylesterase
MSTTVKAAAIAALTTTALVITTAPAVPARPADGRLATPERTGKPDLDGHLTGFGRDPASAQARTGRPARASMLAGEPTVVLQPCADDLAWLCGSLPVPLDRARPAGRKLELAFAVLPRSNTASTATDALFASDGGPGVSNTFHKGDLQWLAGDLTDDRDLVVVDHRGSGQSGAIDCPRLQAIIGDFFIPSERIIRAIGKCGRQLGRDADRYGSGDIAQDLDAVRSALGYDQISMYGLSYAGTFLSAYATRFPEHLRSVVIDAGTAAVDPRHTWTWGQPIPPAMARGVALDCARAPACAAAQPRARTALARLASAVRRQPIRGIVDVYGLGPQRVVVDERNLIFIAADWLNDGELAAAAQALDRGDTRPLLRLGGDHLMFPFEPDDPTIDSAGDNVAAFCNDNDFVWERTDPVPVRRAKYQRARGRHARAHTFAPFSAVGWTEYFLARYCELWPAPGRFTPAVARGATVTDVPTLIISGDRDQQVPTGITRELLRIFPEASFRTIAGAAHPAAGWSECGAEMYHEFVRSLATPTMRCDGPAYVIPTVSKFPLTARRAVPATAAPDDESTTLDRRIATVAVQAARDMLLRSFRVPDSTGILPGLRGGSAAFDWTSWPDVVVTDLRSTRFARDVAVSGRFAWSRAGGNTADLEVVVDGPGSHDGRLEAHGLFGGGPPYQDFAVTGTLGGRSVILTVPAN